MPGDPDNDHSSPSSESSAEEGSVSLCEDLENGIMANYKDWQRRMLSSPDDLHLAKRAAEETLAAEKDWSIKNNDELTAVALMLPHARPRLLKVTIPDPGYMVASLWAQVVELYKGDLQLVFPTDNPSDALLVPLLNRRCRLVFFRGRMKTQEAVSAVASVAPAEAELHVRMDVPLQLGELQGHYKALRAHTRPFGTVYGSQVPGPLPAQPLPELVIRGTPPGAWEEVKHTVVTLAPLGKRYMSLRVNVKRLKDEDVRKAVVWLQEWGIRTAEKGRTYWNRRGKWALIFITDSPYCP